MKKNAMRKNLRQSILKSLGRYLAIVAIIALGASMFVGLLMTKSDMVATGEKFMDRQNMFDLRLLNTYGWTQEQVDAVSQMEGIVDAEGLVYMDIIARQGEAEEDEVYRFYSLPETVNRVDLRGGRMPQAPDECLADGFIATEDLLGTTVTISETNDEDTLDSLAQKTFTIVGFVATPLYMDMNRGTTSVGSGSLSSYFYIPRDAFDVDYFTEINVTIEGDYEVSTDEYNDAMEALADQLEPLLEPLAEDRLIQVKTDAKQAYRDGLAEYQDGLKEFNEGKEEALRELDDAYQQLCDSEKQIGDNEQLLTDGEQQLEDAKEMLKTSEQTMRDSRQALANSKADAYAQLADANAELFANYKTVNSSLQQVNNGILQLNAGMIELNTGITQLESGLSQLDSGIQQMDLLIGIMDVSITTAQTALDVAKQAPQADMETIAELEAELGELKATRDGYGAQRADLAAQQVQYNAQLQDLYAQRTSLEGQQAELEATKAQLEEAMNSINDGFLELENNQLNLENQFASAEAKLEAGELQMESAQAQISEHEQELADGKAALEEAKQELEDGWQEYYDGKAELEEELAKSEADLAEAKQTLDDALEAIVDMTETTVYILDRTSNLGYNSLDSSSDIVQGVSRVFPAFFLLVAALVCITTMTRMIDEERTQIGTLKALGYSNAAIISKYLIYAGSGAVIGCGLGVLAGSVAFPTILWEAYKIMLYITPSVVLEFNWLLCAVVVIAYTAVMLFVTWYCCRRALEEEPAELIRPKAPEAGKKILLEHLPFWHQISFLNKVTIRNIFRYRQRLAMMMVGIGGCTALLVTGFGLRDSIVNVVSYQFDEVTTYDMQVYFTDGQTAVEQKGFLKHVEDCTENVMFYHQESVELDFDNQSREIYMMAAGAEILKFVDFHSGSKALEMPGDNEVLLTVGVAEAMGIDVGDRVILRNADMEQLELTVSGIYDNNVYNYAVVSPESIEAQWARTPEEQMALVQVPEEQDVHEVSAMISGLNDVMNVSVSADLANMVGSMMDALDLVVVVIVVCAGMLAAIVLYNLTNININERIREIATIKVLGFHATETAAYVFKENLSLTVIGTVVGLFLGKVLLEFVMSQIKIDFVWFQARVAVLSYLLAIILTILAACIVDFIFYFKLEKINMAEALKSVE